MLRLGLSDILWVHTKCGGEVDTRLLFRKCKKCGFKWGLIHFWLDPTGIRPVKKKPTSSIYELPRGKTKYAKWADKMYGVGEVASFLPNWPRWLRITSLLCLVGLVWFIIFLIQGGLS